MKQSFVNSLDVRQQGAVLSERASTVEARCCSPTQMNRTNVSLKMRIVTETLATFIANEAFFSIVNRANVSSEVILLAEQFVARGALEIVGFVWIVDSLEMSPQRVVLAESLQTFRTLRTIWSIENTLFLAQRRRQ